MISFTSLLAGKPFRMVKSLMFMFLDIVSVMNEKIKCHPSPQGIGLVLDHSTCVCRLELEDLD